MPTEDDVQAFLSDLVVDVKAVHDTCTHLVDVEFPPPTPEQQSETEAWLRSRWSVRRRSGGWVIVHVTAGAFQERFPTRADAQSVLDELLARPVVQTPWKLLGLGTPLVPVGT